MTSKYFNTALLFDEALIELLKIKEFDYITIKELCNKAGFNRSTFYLHYESTNDVLEECIELINQRFIEKFNMKVNLKTLKKEELNFIDESYLRPYLEFVKENITIFIDGKMFTSTKDEDGVYTGTFVLRAEYDKD